ncbi:MAG: PAS domain S-box protein, partial [Anaerolineaceae bacterium]|nr:PAS domain S-box protein [Anaerolineaceae bacterium]
ALLQTTPNLDALLDFVSHLDETLPTSRLILLFQYSRKQIPASAMLRFMALSPIVMDGTQVYQNLFYQPPRVRSAADPAQAQLDNWMNSLRMAESTRLALSQSRAELQNRVQERTRALRNTNQHLIEQINRRIHTEQELLASQQNLAESQARYSAIFAHSPVVLIEGDLSEIRQFLIEAAGSDDGQAVRAYLTQNPSQALEAMRRAKIINANQRTMELFQLRGESDIAQHFNSLQATASLRYLDEFVAIATGKSNFHAVIHNPTSLMRPMSLELTWQAVPGFESNLGRVIISILDITEQVQYFRALQESEERYRHLVGFVPIPIAVIQDKRYVYANSAVLDLMGYKSLEDINRQGVLEPVIEEYRALLEERLQRTLENKSNPPLEFRLQRSDGTPIIVETWSSPITYNDRPASLIATHDVTQRKQIEEALRESQNFVRKIVETTPNLVYIHDMETLQIVYCNAKVAEVLGYTVEEIIAAQSGFFSSKFHPDDQEAMRKHREDMLLARDGEIFDITYRMIRKDGSWAWLRSQESIFLRNPDGSTRQIIGTAEDVTEQLRAREALLQSERKYRLLVEQSYEAIVLADETGMIIEWNASAEKIFKLQRAEVVGRPLWDVMYSVSGPEYKTPEKYAALKEAFAGLLATGKGVWFEHTYEAEMEHLDGSPFVVQSNVYAIKTEKGFLVCSTSRDVSEQKANEKALQESEQRFRLLYEDAPLGYQSLNAQGILVEVNHAWLNLLGYQAEEVLGCSFGGFLTPASREFFQGMFDQFIHNGRIHGAEFEVIRKNGSVLNVVIDGQLSFDAYGNFRQTHCILYDITDRKRAEQILQQSEERLRTIIENMPVMLDAMDVDNNFVLWNRESERVTGYSEDEMVGNPNAWDMLYPDQEYRQAMIAESIARSREKADFRSWIWNLTCKDGSVRNIAWSNISSEFPIAGWHSWAIGVDVTEQARAEVQLERSLNELRALSAHLQSVREEERASISREIHDELGQSLTGLKMDLYWLKSKIEKQDTQSVAQARLNKIASMVMVVDLIIDAVRRISTELRPSVLDTLGLVPAIEWLSKDFQSRSGTKCRFRSRLPDMEIDPKLSTALFRICQESLTNVVRHAQATRISISLRRENGDLVLEIQDNGTGIRQEDIEDIKSIGLIGMRERAHMFGGKIEFNGKSGIGTQILARFPYLEAQAGEN